MTPPIGSDVSVPTGDVASAFFSVPSLDLHSDHTCSRVFSLSDSRPFWEAEDTAPPRCGASSLGVSDARVCLRRLTNSRQRPAHLVLVGDSRARILLEWLSAELELQFEGRPVQDLFPDVANASRHVVGHPALCTEGFKLFDSTRTHWQKLACSLVAASPLLRVEFFWRAHADDAYLNVLNALADECGRGGACPDLVVLTAGYWYAKPFQDETRMPLQERVLRFRKDMLPFARHVQALAAFTKVVWKLDGPEMTESSGKNSLIGGVILSSNAVVFDVYRQALGAQPWTSSLADTLRFYHSVCLPLAAQRALHTQAVRHECLDENHVGASVRATAGNALLSFVCHRALERRPGHCCGAGVQSLV
ncbi:uncharacterized protein LOC119108174 [Pollicipes pollicipes]|uniref:uncharacterized protein LOC119108174 n=1 Tax=Pollicipes pollicipes TaxID=41117 RepID=UPI0018850119|nr:uncharacterized protein LOC119108174 [Pollicipes pollicipes]